MIVIEVIQELNLVTAVEFICHATQDLHIDRRSFKNTDPNSNLAYICAMLD